jgi:diguanylate cyclase (GGDEF)-like protein
MPFFIWPSYLDLCASIFTFFLTLGLAKYVWDHRKIPGMGYFFSLCLSVCLLSLIYFLEIISTKLADKIFLENTRYSILDFLPIFYLAFILLFTNQKKAFRRPGWPILFIQPAANLVVIWTNLFPNWFRTGASIEYLDMNFPGILNSYFGNWYWFCAIYIIILLLIDLVFLLKAYFHSPHWARNKLWFLILGLFIPWIVSLTTIPGSIFKDQNYLLMLSVAISLTIVAWGVLRSRVLDILPIAREAILDQITDIFFVINLEGRIVDFNQSAKLNPIMKPNLQVGLPFNKLLPEFSTIKFIPHIESIKEMEITLHRGFEPQIFKLRISPLVNENQAISGWLVIFHDITELKQEENDLRKAETRAEQSLKFVQQRSQELNIIRKTTDFLNQATSLRGALIPTFETIRNISKSEQLWVCLLDPETGNNHREIFFYPDQTQLSLKYFDNLPNTLPCLQDLINSDSSGAQFYSETTGQTFAAEITRKAYISLPLRTRFKSLGVLNIALDNKECIDEDIYPLIETICASLSVAIDRVRLLKSEYSERRLAEAFRQINNNLTASLNLADVLDLLLEQVSRLIPFDAGCVMFVEGENAWITRKKGYEFLGKESNQLISQTNFPLENTKNLRQIVASKEPYLIENTHLEPNWVPIAGTQVFHSWVGAPVIIDHKVAFIFSLDKKEIGFFKPNHAKHLVTFCSEVSLAIQNARLYEAGQKRIKELESLQATLKGISSQLDLAQLLKYIMESALSLLESTSGVMGLYQEEANNFKIAINISEGKDLTGNLLQPNEGLMGIVAASKEPFTLDDYSTWDKHLEEYVSAFPHAVLEVPLIAGEKLVGVLAIGDANPQRKYNEDDIQLLSLFAQQATIALTNARLFTNAQQRAEEAETLRQASAIVASTLKQKKALHLILEQLSLVIPYDSASILLLKGNELELVEGRGFTNQAPPLGLRISLDQNQPGALVFKQRKPLVVKNMPLEFPDFLKFVETPILSWIGVPLIFKNRMIGILSLDSLEVNRYTENQANLVSAFAAQVAVALENVRLYESAVQSAKRFSALYKLGQRISLNLQPTELFQAIYDATNELMSSDSFFISLYDEEKKRIDDVYFIDNGILQERSSRPFGKNIFSQVITEDQTLMFNSFNKDMLKQNEGFLFNDDIRKTPVQSMIVVPLRIGNQAKGVISTQSYQANAYTKHDRETLEMLATQSVIALENSRLFNEIQKMAMTDSLTNIYNRRKFFELADLEFDRARRYQHSLSLIMMDIDLFKIVNDTFGHAAGDLVLKHIAKLYLGSTRTVDTFARYGGEEFVILLPETAAIEAYHTAERLRLLIARSPFLFGENAINITISFGVVEMDASCKNMEELLDRSDQALYFSKNNGRNQVTVWSANLPPVRDSGSNASLSA